jgi:hypothetical protein
VGGGWPTINRHDRILFGERGDNLSHRVTFELLAPSKSPYGHVVLHHGAFLQLVPNGVRMIGTGCLEKHLEVISGLPRLALEVALSSGDKLLVGVIGILVIVTLIIAASDRDSLEPSFCPLLVTFGALLCALAGCLDRCPSTAVGGRSPTVLDKNGPNHVLAGGMPGGDVKELFHGLRLVTAEFMHQGSAVRARPERQNDVGVTDLGELVALSGERWM